jgi:16S rRNA (adenine1518-N6/adenine1519-N6)-dimethyltransferase
LIPETPSSVRAALDELGIRPSRRRGQNFLADRNLRDAIVRAAGVAQRDLVLEVGPGLGTLTLGLLRAGATVVAAEIDRRLHAFLEEAFGEEPRLELIHGDALGGDGLAPRVEDALARRRPDARRRLLVSNLPYSAGTPVLAAEARSETPPDRTVVMVQREVALRMAGAPGTPDYGPLAVLHALRGRVRILREVGGRVFVPPTEVRSAVVEVVPHPVERDALIAGDRAARECFLHRRKTTRRALTLAGHCAERVEGALKDAGADPARRPERLDPEQFVAIGLALYGSSD